MFFRSGAVPAKIVIPKLMSCWCMVIYGRCQNCAHADAVQGNERSPCHRDVVVSIQPTKSNGYRTALYSEICNKKCLHIGGRVHLYIMQHCSQYPFSNAWRDYHRLFPSSRKHEEVVMNPWYVAYEIKLRMVQSNIIHMHHSMRDFVTNTMCCSFFPDQSDFWGRCVSHHGMSMFLDCQVHLDTPKPEN